MNFLALLIGLGVERALTHLFHLRAFQWLDPVFDRALARLAGSGRAGASLGIACLALLLAAPVAWASMALSAQSEQWPYFLFAIVVLLFSLGPRDLQEEVEEYCVAVRGGAADTARRLARELLERDIGVDAAGSTGEIRRAIFLQANNRIFGVVFWFLVLGPAGPAGAWLFRVLDLLRQRAVAGPQAASAALPAARVVHGLVAWIPGRLMAVAFALAGDFLGAIAGWRAAGGDRRGTFFEHTETLIAATGEGACSAPELEEPDDEVAGSARLALALVRRALWLIWYPAIALLTLNNWLQ